MNSPGEKGEAELLAVTPSPPETKRARRCVQSKLCWGSGQTSKGGNAVEAVDPAASVGVEEGSNVKRRGRGRPRKSTANESHAEKETIVLSTAGNSDRTPEVKKCCKRATTTLKVPGAKRCDASQLQYPGSGTSLQVKDGSIDTMPIKNLSFFYHSSQEVDSPSPSRQLNGSTVLNNLGVQNHVNRQLKFDLRAEAKLAAETNARLFAGKQIHPFFVRHIVCKKLPDTDASVNIDHKDSLPVCGDISSPIHVFDSLEVSTSCDWSNWRLKEGSLLDKKHLKDQQRPQTMPEVVCEYQSFDTSNNSFRTEATDAAKEILGSREVFKDQKILGTLPLLTDFIYGNNDGHLTPDFRNNVDSIENVAQNVIFNRRNRLECCQWTDKYQPENSSQVCGNSEAVGFLSKWLQSWDTTGRRRRQNDKTDSGISDEDYSCEDDTYLDDDDSEDICNVVLITGPVGCGKSAAIYACAKEQGFHVFEVNASDLRNGALIKQKFGEATESCGLNKWFNEETIGEKKIDPGLMPAILYSRQSTDSKELSCDGHRWQLGTDISWSAEDSVQQMTSKTLILFEDVDTVFDEDRGFLSAILQLSSTTKWPIILTSNNKSPILPQQLSHHLLQFKYPSHYELISQLEKICVNEELKISSFLMDHIINSFLGDIRRTLLFLQFWCQGRKCIDFENESSSDSFLFDLDAVHFVIPSFLPWGFPCGLSEKVYEEVNSTVSLMENTGDILEFSEPNEVEPNSRCASACKAKNTRRKFKLKKDQPILDVNEIPACWNDLDDFNDVPSTPPSNRKTAKSGQGRIFESDDELNFATPQKVLVDSVHVHLPGMTATDILCQQDASNPKGLPLDSTCVFHQNDRDVNHAETSRLMSVSHISDTIMFQDMSHVPESSYLQGKEENQNDDLASLAVVSSCQLPARISETEFSGLGRQGISGTHAVELSFGDGIVDVRNDYITPIVDDTSQLGFDSVLENVEPNSCSTSGYQFMDECSRAGNSWFSVGKIAEKYNEIDCMQDTWNRLRSSRDDLKPYVTDCENLASKMLTLSSRIADLVADADVMSLYYNSNDTLCWSRMVAEPDDLWHPGQSSFGSSYAHQGLCSYINACATECGTREQSSTNLTQAVHLASKNPQFVGKHLNMECAKRMTSQNGIFHVNKQPSCLSQRGGESRLYDAVLPIIPKKLSMSFKGLPFHEYLSSISQISRIECSRIEEIKNIDSYRRSRDSRHYLSSGANALAPEDIAQLAQISCYNIAASAKD